MLVYISPETAVHLVYPGKKYIDQEPPSKASNLCTSVGGDQNKEFRGNAAFLREKGPRGGIKMY